MHELSVTQSIVKACCERAAGTRVLRVTLEVGTLSCVMPESLRFCYDVVAAGTELQGSELEIIRVPGFSRCIDCDAEVEMTDILSACRCGSGNLQRTQGGDRLLIKSIELGEAA